MANIWSEFRKTAKRKYSKQVWVPLGLSKLNQIGDYPGGGYLSEYEGAHTLVVPQSKREFGENYSWSDNHEHTPWGNADFYKPADSYSHNDRDIVGFRLALRQTFPDRPDMWHLHQDFILAFGLAFERNSWVRPSEDYVEVARHVLDAGGDVCGIEAKSEYLKDYLCARHSALRISSFRSVDTIIADGEPSVGFEEGTEENFEGGRLEFRAMQIDENGHPAGSGVAVFHMSRNDIDPDDDVPEIGPESDENTAGKSWSFNRGDAAKTSLMGDFWRDEWLEPAKSSLRVRGDDVPSNVTFIVSADGERMSADDLNFEDVGRWLWFKPAIIASLLERRGAELNWYTRLTAGISTPADTAIHFGINSIGLVNVYAFDIARLPEWERQRWAGFNTTPDGKVSPELLSSQVEAKPASTQSPEQFLPIVIDQLDNEWVKQFGERIFRKHDSFDEIVSKCHRFRTLEKRGIFALAKDIARLTADLIDAKVAQKHISQEEAKGLGSLKSLEKAVATRCSGEFARRITGPLFATYELRLSDAHLPKSDIADALGLLGIEEDDAPILAGEKMIHMVVASLDACRRVIANELEASPDS